MAKDEIRSYLCSMDYRLNGFSVKEVLEDIDEAILEINCFLSTATMRKGFFYSFLKELGEEKKFHIFAKGHEGSQRVLYTPYIKTLLTELKENLDRKAGIFKDEKEDRRNKRHRKCILNMLPLIWRFGFCYVLFCARMIGFDSPSIKLKNGNRDIEKELKRVK